MGHSDSVVMRVIDVPQQCEPEPVWFEAPRLCEDRELPGYRYVRGLNPHPRLDKRGHSYETPRRVVEMDPEHWSESEDYLFGIDLYHQGYFWESCEVWEALHRSVGGDSPPSNLLHALFLNSAAQIRAHRRNARGTRTRSQAARWRLARIRAKGFDGPEKRFMGLDIGDLIDQICRHYSPVWESSADEHIHLKGPAPRLLLED